MKDYLRFDLTEQVRREQDRKRFRDEARVLETGFILGVLFAVIVFLLLQLF